MRQSLNAAPESVPGGLDLARQKLASAIEKRDAALAHLQKINSAIAKTPLAWELSDAVDEAREALRLAKMHEPELTLARVLGQALGGGDTVEAAEQRLAKAEAAVADARAVQQSLAASADKARQKLDWETSSVRKAVGEVLHDAPGLAALLEAWRAANRKAATLKAALSAVMSESVTALPHNWDIEPYNWAPDAGRSELANTWREAIRQFDNDPNAKLPDVKDKI